MTILALDSSVSSDLKHGKMFPEASNGPLSPVSNVPLAWTLPRINLRKRSSCSAKKINLTSVNSAFLTGLFADVANLAEEPSSNDHQPCSKKTRISKTKSMSRCGRSFKILTETPEEQIPDSPIKANTSFFGQVQDATTCTYERVDSLLFQLDCVSSSSENISSATLFPHLPATVSNSSCGTTLTRVISDLQSSLTEKLSAEEKDSYGWFVEMEDDSKDSPQTTPEVTDPYASTSSQDLAFSAHTAPKAENYDAELEWATAADTVDDVLGDFF